MASASSTTSPLRYAGDAALFAAMDETMAELIGRYSALSEAEVNTVPFEGSWTPAQLVVHVTKSTKGIVQGMDFPGEPAIRPADARVDELGDIFLNFDHKLNSPPFILPKPGHYAKTDTISLLEHSLQQLREKRNQKNLAEEIDFAALGKMTRMELLYFVVFHTRRHIHQLKKMISQIRK